MQGEEAYHAAWERGSCQHLEATIRSLFGAQDAILRLTANQALLEPLNA